ncbi:hypothetical protein RHK24_18660 [Clostridioides difficile]|nr:hypothetical protein [Clostridioides difficile]
MKDVWLYSWDDECFRSDEYEVKKKLSRQLRKNLRGSEKLNDGFILEKKKKLIFPT